MIVAALGRQVRLRWLWLLAMLAWGHLSAPLAAQERSSRSALIVGVSTYASPDVSTLTGVPADIPLAQDMARAMGIPLAQTQVLRDAQATKAGVLAALEKLASEVNEGGRVFIYFSGHGTRWFDPKSSACKEGLLAHDGQAITNEEIAVHTRRIHALADKLIVVFDACHSGGVGHRERFTRSALRGALTPKFYSRSEADAAACERPSNLTRSLLAESARVGGLSDNFVQVTSARPDEVSFDEPGKGGLATQGLHGCLLGGAADSNGSGAVSLAEVESCTQAAIEAKLKPWPQLIPHRVTVSGNRNLVPVPAQPVLLAPSGPEKMTMTTPATTSAAASVTTPEAVSGSIPAQANGAQDPPPALASLATLEDIAQQQNPRRKLQIKPSSTVLRMGQDALDFSVTSSHDGYLYLVLLGSDQRSFYLLFPNGLDADNHIRANRPVRLPRPSWRLMAKGPAGTNRVLALVTDTPRDLKALKAAPADAAAPFTFTLNDWAGRAALVDFFTGRGVTGSSESFGAQLLAIEERP